MPYDDHMSIAIAFVSGETGVLSAPMQEMQ